MQHEDWTDAGEKLGRDDLRGVLMPGGHAKDSSSTFPRPSVKCEDNWNEVRVLLVAHSRSREVAVLRESGLLMNLVVYCVRRLPNSDALLAASQAMT